MGRKIEESNGKIERLKNEYMNLHDVREEIDVKYK
jgi:hypothetical protein